MILSRLGDVESMVEGIMVLPFVMFGIFAVAFIVAVVLIIVKIVKRVKKNIDNDGMTQEPENESTIATIFKKTFENAQAKLESESAQYKKVNCPYCGAVNKGSDTKCSSCSAPLNGK